ncbi:hypothetical protein SAMN05421805_105252 [Saccharopolyspora antimicrobica]|uniref:Uncharacterized protein n=1 Tax=Saccharopolyspora antimicrobica TaxID=455193 RepID=A0A1I5A5M6_9PSEU|nr:hypothetical protein [Saccharopolyspora antimicrobica]RKT83265.1 hypothetical protein ATL45_1544 [Saccharopolyspora antimicrobica]SFN57737.1 hypothetical protein SAMN05421805_105252 [Saccharopolyspora antimicrobica]
MSEQNSERAAPAYAVAQWTAALEAARSGDHAALEKVRRWEDVLAGMAGGRLRIGSRTPVADTPPWVTLEVAHGGFATGRYLAEAPLSDAEQERLVALPDDVPGETDRERLNLWYLGDTGRAELLAAVRSGTCRIDVPEESALAVAALLLDRGFAAQALDLVAELRPLMHRLRFTPRFESVPQPSGAAVRLAPVGEVAASLRRVRVPAQLAAMRETLEVWNPLHDRLVELWCSTVDGALPHLDEERNEVRGGWPCRRWPDDWVQARIRWLDDYTRTCREHAPSGRHAHPKSNFARLRAALLACPVDSAELSGREVGWIRRALANTTTRHGAPNGELRASIRAAQAESIAAPTHASIAELVAARLDHYPADGGVPSLEPIAAAVSEEDGAGGVPVGTAIPEHLVDKVARALEAPVDELVRRGVITSGEVLARVLPQLTARFASAGLDDPVLAGVHEQTYTAFRRRRSLLLLNLEQQVRFDELPWVRALAVCRSPRVERSVAAHRSLQQAVLLAITSFPQALLPNPLVREFGAMSVLAGIRMPLVEEVAADIFTGTFVMKWRDAAVLASRAMAGTVYAAYYDLPPAWPEARRIGTRWGRRTADDFTALCAARAEEAGSGRGFISRNGAVLEQSQILTTHNLAVLVHELGLAEQLREHAPELVRRTFDWIVARLRQQPASDHHAALIQVKNAAYAWRQAIFLLGFCDPREQRARLGGLDEAVRGAGLTRFAPAVEGLAHVLGGGRFDESGTTPNGGRRFLGWARGKHWYFGD